jgi:hypothetical protein
MRPIHIFAGALLCGVLISPVGLKAQESKKTTTTTTTTETQRYYDPVEKDYHAWNDSEDHAYRVYLQDNHHDYLEFGKANEKERTEYFKWRHGHPDSVIVKEKEKH